MAVCLEYEILRKRLFVSDKAKEEFDLLSAAEEILFKWDDFAELQKFTSEQYLSILSGLPHFIERGYLGGEGRMTLYEKLKQVRPIFRRRLL